MQLQIIRTNNRTSAYGNLQVLSVAQCNSQHVTTVTSNQRQRIKIDHVTSAFGNTTKKQERVLLFNPLSFSSVVIFCLRSTVRELILLHCVLSLPRERRHNTHHYPLLPNQLGFFFFFFFTLAYVCSCKWCSTCSEVQTLVHLSHSSRQHFAIQGI